MDLKSQKFCEQQENEENYSFSNENLMKQIGDSSSKAVYSNFEILNNSISHNDYFHKQDIDNQQRNQLTRLKFPAQIYENKRNINKDSEMKLLELPGTMMMSNAPTLAFDFDKNAEEEKVVTPSVIQAEIIGADSGLKKKNHDNTIGFSLEAKGAIVIISGIMYNLA